MRFIIRKEYKKYLYELKGVNDRIAYIKLRMEKKELTIIQVYAPTAETENETNEESLPPYSYCHEKQPKPMHYTPEMAT